MSRNEYNKKYRQENKGELFYWITKIYGRMKRDNKNKFNIDLPFTKDEFKKWLDDNYKTEIRRMLTEYKNSN